MDDIKKVPSRAATLNGKDVAKPTYPCRIFILSFLILNVNLIKKRMIKMLNDFYFVLFLALIYLAGWVSCRDYMRYKVTKKIFKPNKPVHINKQKLWDSNAAEADALFDESEPTFAPKETSLRKEEEACFGNEKLNAVLYGTFECTGGGECND